MIILLYAKQSYTGGTVCSYPYSYVEPFPEFYQTLKDFSVSSENKIQPINFSDPGYPILYYKHILIHLVNVMDTLKINCGKRIESGIIEF